MDTAVWLVLVLVLGALADDNLEPYFDKIVGGLPDTANRFPYQVAIRRKSDAALICGGAIISGTHVLTAAHCLYHHNGAKIDAGLMVAAAGYSSEQDVASKVAVDVLSYCVHPRYSAYDPALRHDIALVRVSSPGFAFNAHTRSVPFHAGDVSANTECTVSGWGSINNQNDYAKVLQFVTLPVVTPDICRKQYKDSFDSNFQVCVREEDGARDFCDGDSGGPLVCAGSLLALVSYNNMVCADHKWSSVFTKVSPYIPWIKVTMSTSYCPSKAAMKTAVSRPLIVILAIVVSVRHVNW